MVDDDPNTSIVFDQPKAFKSVDFNADGSLLACARYDGKIYIADVQTGEILTTLQERGWDDPRIVELLGESHRETGRTLSLREVTGE